MPKRTPTEAYVNTCSGCDATWTGYSRAHCSACHRTFNGAGLFDAHRAASTSQRRKGTCIDPATMVKEHRDGSTEPAMYLVDGIWCSVPTLAPRGQNLARRGSRSAPRTPVPWDSPGADPLADIREYVAAASTEG